MAAELLADDLPHRAQRPPALRFADVGVANVVLFPLRVIAWLVLWVVALVATVTYSFFAERYPSAADACFYAASKWSSRALLAAAGFRVTVRGGARDATATLVVANHVAVYDPWARRPSGDSFTDAFFGALHCDAAASRRRIATLNRDAAASRRRIATPLHRDAAP